MESQDRPDGSPSGDSFITEVPSSWSSLLSAPEPGVDGGEPLGMPTSSMSSAMGEEAVKDGENQSTLERRRIGEAHKIYKRQIPERMESLDGLNDRVGKREEE